MHIAAALIYWLIVALWLSVFATVCAAFARNPRTFDTTRLLLSVIVIDTIRNVIENLYFGLYFGAQYGFFSPSIVDVLGNPAYLILPKVMNVVAAAAVLGLLVLRWLPLASKERSDAEANLQMKVDALRQETEERQRLFEISLDLVSITDRRGIFRRVSPSSLSMLGYAPYEMIGRNAAEFIVPDDLAAARREMQLARMGQNTRNFESRFVHKDGRLVPIAWSSVWSEPEQKHFFFGRDMTERKAAEDRLRHLALFDQLTGLPNRASLQSDVATFLDAGAGQARALTVAALDLDRFQDINETLGHSVGDKLLQEVARRLTTFSADARIYRLGDDEFILLLEHCGDPLAATELITTALQQLMGQFELEDHQLHLTASAGIAIAPSHGSNLDDLLANAELALHDAKAASGRSYRLYVPTLRARAKHRRELQNELRRACANQEFVLHFQPQVRSSDGALVAAEALIRWQHPERGILAPGAFVDALCESAVAADAGRWILETACTAAASWRAKGLPGIRIGVNLFAAQFRSGTLQQDVEDALSRNGLPADALELEITENIALGSEEETLAPLRALRARGVVISFDDFGTGYASLSYLTRYPLSQIKIDRHFIRKIGAQSTGEDAAIVRWIIAMGSNLGLEVVAEGVETVAQAEFLRDEGCDVLQGFLFSKPLAADAFEQYLRSSVLGSRKSGRSARRRVG